jgi:2-polyprenyl-3-methyl-5-hydroxy-6-metoxy-1,4-benzoquinol methylase
MRTTSSVGLEVDEELLARLKHARAAGDSGFPRLVVVVLGAENPTNVLRATLERIPPALRELIAEVTVLLETPAGVDTHDETPLTSLAWPNLRVLHEPRRYAYGERRKVALAYACDAGFDFVALLEGNGCTPPEKLPELVSPALLERRPVVLAVRPLSRTGWTTTSRSSQLVRLLLSHLHNAVLGLRLSDWDSSYRVLSTSLLRRLPFRVNADDRIFDTDILIQCRVLGVPVHQIPLPLYDDAEMADSGLGRQLLSLGAAVGYRLHQLHLVRRGQYLVSDSVLTGYTLKRSSTGSHMQIIEAVAPRARVLDLGCSQGLLAGPLRAKGVRVTGVDVLPPDRVGKDLEAYYQQDLEEPLELPEGRIFDAVVISDVLEHVREPQRLLRAARQHLKPDGRLFVSTGNVALWFYRASLLVGRFEYGPRGILDATHVHLYTRASFRREIEDAGFRVLRERVTALPFEVVLRSTGQSRLVGAIAQGYHLLARLWPGMFAYQFLIEAEATRFYDEPGTLAGKWDGKQLADDVGRFHRWRHRP